MGVMELVRILVRRSGFATSTLNPCIGLPFRCRAFAVEKHTRERSRASPVDFGLEGIPIEEGIPGTSQKFRATLR